jgi:hypothetical protein
MRSRPPCDAPSVFGELSGKINAAIKVNIDATRLSIFEGSVGEAMRNQRFD